MATALIHMPASAKAGEIIEVRALIAHPILEPVYQACSHRPLLPSASSATPKQACPHKVSAWPASG